MAKKKTRAREIFEEAYEILPDPDKCTADQWRKAVSRCFSELSHPVFSRAVTSICSTIAARLQHFEETHELEEMSERSLAGHHIESIYWAARNVAFDDMRESRLANTD